MKAVAKIGIGTAQWGMNYGIANRSGQPDNSDIRTMLHHARQYGLSILDTAHAYGEAEKILGEQNACSLGFKVVTKTIPIQDSLTSKKDVSLVFRAFAQSLDRLKSDQVYGLLVHSPDNLLSPGGDLLWEKLQELKLQKRVLKIGVSVYHPQQLEEILSRYEIDLVQTPFNIYDQRFTRTDLFARLKQKSVEIHARSGFLQGLLLMKPDDLPDQFELIRNHQIKLHSQLNQFGLSPLQGCLSFCLNQPHIDKIIVGCETFRQFTEILKIAEKSPISLPELESYAINDEKVIDPSKWPQ